jgi:hypothetical protein
MLCRGIYSNRKMRLLVGLPRLREYNQIRLHELAGPSQDLAGRGPRLCKGQECRQQKHRVVYWVFARLCRVDQ